MRKTTFGVAAALVLGATQASALEPADFRVHTTGDLVKLCSVGEDDTLYSDARAFCLGYVDGVWDYHQALTIGEKFDAIACPDASVTRDQAVDVLLAWAAKNGQILDDETPVHGVMRAVSEQWPCKSN